MVPGSVPEGSTLRRRNTEVYAEPRSWEFPRSKLTLGKRLGEGNFGEVYQGTATGIERGVASSVVAVKLLKPTSGEAERAEFWAEAKLMMRMPSHPHVVGLLGVCTLEEPLLLLVEFCSNGNLLDFLRRARPAANTPAKLSPARLMQFAVDIAYGGEFLASQRLVHRDLAARNVLIDGAHHARIADFGLSRETDDGVYSTKTRGQKLPVKWLAPECMLLQQFSSASDVWAFGVVLYEVATFGLPPYPELTAVETAKLIIKEGLRITQPSVCSDEFYSLMSDCWEEHPSSRPTFRALRLQLSELAKNAARHINYTQDGKSADYLEFRLMAASDIYEEPTRQDPGVLPSYSLAAASDSQPAYSIAGGRSGGEATYDMARGSSGGEAVYDMGSAGDAAVYEMAATGRAAATMRRPGHQQSVYALGNMANAEEDDEQPVYDARTMATMRRRPSADQTVYDLATGTGEQPTYDLGSAGESNYAAPAATMRRPRRSGPTAADAVYDFGNMGDAGADAGADAMYDFGNMKEVDT